MINMIRSACYFTIVICLTACSVQKKQAGIATTKQQVTEIITRVNDYWQGQHKPEDRAFWDVAAYHTGNMAAYQVTKNEAYKNFSTTWAQHNNWMGATGSDKTAWKYKYGETPDHVLFGDWQIAFQTYADLYNLDKDEKKIARAREVMEYQMSTSNNDYWWWADGLYMVMPVMTKLHNITGNYWYLQKLYEYFTYADSVMYDAKAGLYYRDARYVFPGHKTINGQKDFWSRGDGWVFAGLAKVLKDLPKNYPHRNLFLNRYLTMAKALKAAQQPDGYWTRSLLDPQYAPGPETSGTAFFTFGMLWGINNGILSKAEYLPVAQKGWNYLTNVAMQANGKIGYVQPIGDRAIPGQVVDVNSTANFGVGAFLLAASEMYSYLSK